MPTLKLHSDCLLHSNMLIGTLAVDVGTLAWLVGTPVGTLMLVHWPLMAGLLPTSYYLMWHYNCLSTLNG